MLIRNQMRTPQCSSQAPTAHGGHCGPVENHQGNTVHSRVPITRARRGAREQGIRMDSHSLGAGDRAASRAAERVADDARNRFPCLHSQCVTGCCACWKKEGPCRRKFVEGFSLHANTHLHANDRKGLERLCRYGARGALALERCTCSLVQEMA